MYRNNNKVFSQQQFKDPHNPQQLISEPSPVQAAPYSLRKGKLISILLAALLLCCLCILPWPTDIDLTLPGGQIDHNGALIQEGDIRLQGNHYEYLFRKDKIKLIPNIPGLTLHNATWQPMTYSTALGEYMYASQMIYVQELSGYTLFRIFLANDYSWCLIKAEDYLFFGTSDPNLTAETILTENPLS